MSIQLFRLHSVILTCISFSFKIFSYFLFFRHSFEFFNLFYCPFFIKMALIYLFRYIDIFFYSIINRFSLILIFFFFFLSFVWFSFFFFSLLCSSLMSSLLRNSSSFIFVSFYSSLLDYSLSLYRFNSAFNLFFHSKSFYLFRIKNILFINSFLSL